MFQVGAPGFEPGTFWFQHALVTRASASPCPLQGIPVSDPRQPSVKVYGAKPRTPQSEGSPLLAGVITAILLAVLWTLLVYATHHPVGVAAWGVGGLVGLTVAKFAREPGPSLGILAAVLTLAAAIFAKILILAFALGPILRDEILRSREATRS